MSSTVESPWRRRSTAAGVPGDVGDARSSIQERATTTTSRPMTDYYGHTTGIPLPLWRVSGRRESDNRAPTVRELGGVRVAYPQIIITSLFLTATRPPKVTWTPPNKER
ncbi:hypothetical protein J6590_072528 [Homalodisca vitripennis]|nr:hypothetical protein J6590_072528 [Homalodisca vitripennis]